MFRDRIEAARPEGAAAEEAAHGEPRAPAGAVHLERFDCVAGTARGESARGRAAVEGPLVPAHRSQQPARRRAQDDAGVAGGVVMGVRVGSMRESNRSRSTSSSANDRPAAAGVAPMRYKPAGRRGSCIASRARRRRRRRLRVTAGPTERPMAYATCGGEARGSSTNVHHRTPARARDPVRDRRSNEDRPRTRPIKRTDGDGPWPGEPSTRRGRREWPCGRGSRASWHAASCWVERCASTQTSSAGSTRLRTDDFELTRHVTGTSPEPCKATGWAPNLATRLQIVIIAGRGACRDLRLDRGLWKDC